MNTKVAFVGAGSFVFGPTMLAQALLENRMDGLTLALIDPASSVLEPMAELGRRMSEAIGLDTQIATYESASAPGALEGADFVISCAAVGMNRRFAMDRDIIREVYPEHLITEFGGVQGISSSMRQLTFVGSLAAEMRKRCPDAVLLDVANPMPRLCQMAHEEGVKTIGFCSVSISGYGRLWRILREESIDYPFTAAREAYKVTMGGTNHLSWLVSVEDRATGEDLMPELLRRLAAREGSVKSKSEAWGRKTGHFPMSGDDHIQDFLPPEGLEHSIEISSHGSDADRARRMADLLAASRGEASWESLIDHPSWERPFDVIRALRGGEPTEVDSLNLVNEGQIPQLPWGVYVETAAVADADGVRAIPLNLPESVIAIARATAEQHDLLVRAARAKSLSLVMEAVENDPTILDKTKGRAAIERCLAAHVDLIGVFGE